MPWNARLERLTIVEPSQKTPRHIVAVPSFPYRYALSPASDLFPTDLTDTPKGLKL